MLTLLFANIGYMLTGLLSFAILMSVATTTMTGVKSATMLILTASLGWMATWYNPYFMMMAHFSLLCVGLLFLTGPIAIRLLTSLLAMLVADAVMVVWFSYNPVELTNVSLFWWRSVLNAIFIYQCLIVLTWAKHGFLKAETKKGRKNGFLARIRTDSKSA